MKHAIKLILVSVLLSLAACSTAPTQTTIIDTPHLNPNLPPQVELQSVQFKVYTATDLKRLSTQKNVVLFTLTPEQYAILGKNLVAVHGYILELKQTVIFYKNQNTATTPVAPTKN